MNTNTWTIIGVGVSIALLQVFLWGDLRTDLGGRITGLDTRLSARMDALTIEVRENRREAYRTNHQHPPPDG